MPCLKQKGLSWLDKVRFIANYAVNGCETTLQIYVDTGAYAAENLVLNLAGISPTEAVYTMLRPKGARTDRHGGGRTPRNVAKGRVTGPGGKFFQGEEAIPDTAEVVQNTIETITEWTKPVYSNGGEAVFEIAKPVIQSAYYITLVSAATDFAYDWYSGILLNPGSHCAGNRFSYLGFWTDPPTQAYTDWPVAREEFHPEGAHLSPDGLVIEQGTWVIRVEFQGVPNNLNPAEAQMFVRLVLGIDKKQCSTAIPIGFEPFSSADQTVRWVHKVSAPDILMLQLSVFSTHNPFPVDGGFYRLSGFAI